MDLAGVLYTCSTYEVRGAMNVFQILILTKKLDVMGPQVPKAFSSFLMQLSKELLAVASSPR